MILTRTGAHSLLIVTLILTGQTQVKAHDSNAQAGSTKNTLAGTELTHPCARKSASQLNKRAQPYQRDIQQYARRYGVEEALIKAVITIESCYRQTARSHKGAQGLMQLIPATAERFGVSDAYDSSQNLRGGTRYLSWLSKRFDGNLSKVLAGYNAGEGKVDRYNGIPPYKETRHYVHNVLGVYKKLKQHQAKTTQKQVAQSPRTDSTLTPKQSAAQLAARRAQLQRQQAALQKQRQIQLRKQQQATRSPARQADTHITRHKQAPQAKPPQNVTQVVMIQGGLSQPVRVQHAVAQPQHSQATPRQTHTKQPKQAQSPPQHHAKALQANTKNQRIRQIYKSPFKPGRAGWQANKAMAPQLYKR